MWRVGDTVFQHLHQAGFANTSFTTQQYDLSAPVLALCPAP
jgi:hypothetical protein